MFIPVWVFIPCLGYNIPTAVSQAGVYIDCKKTEKNFLLNFMNDTIYPLEKKIFNFYEAWLTETSSGKWSLEIFIFEKQWLWK